MNIALHTFEATKIRKTGLENHAVQLIQMLQKHHSLQGIIQTNRRLPLFENSKPSKPWLDKFKIIIPFFQSFLEKKNHLDFAEIETQSLAQSTKLNTLYQHFTKLHLSSHCYDVIKFKYWMSKRQALIEIPEIKDVDIFWLTSPFPMWMNNKINICTVHDTFTKGHHELCENNTTHLKLKQIIERFDMIFAVSTYTKQQLLQLFPNLRPDKIQVSYQPIPDKNLLTQSKTQQTLFLQKLGLKTNQFFLHVGSLIPRKNQKNMILAFLKCNLEIPLVMVGKKTKSTSHHLLQLIKENYPRILWLNHIQDDSLNTLYQHAKALLFPSTLEGFGLPILEAFHHRCPVITSNTSAMPEIAGNGALYVNPSHIEEIQHQIMRILQDAALRKQLIEAGTQQSTLFSVDNVLKRIENRLGILLRERNYV